MTDRQWTRVLELYETLSAMPPDSAEARLHSATEDPAVLREVAAMIQADRRAESDTFPPGDNAPQQYYEGAVIGRYDVVARIGRGSTGDVYSGRDRELQRPVALKVVASETAGSGFRDRFIREARAASALNHPNIVTIHEVITFKSSPVIVMELVQGSALRSVLAEPLPLARSLDIGRQLLQALAFTHAEGIIHRDLKPENIMVRPDGLVKLLDLGLARRMILDPGNSNISSTPGMPVGTLRYMSPEQCRGETATAASDVFAAGIVLYEMVAGRHPFGGGSPLETAHAIANSRAAPLGREVPEPICDLIGRMLSKEAAARPSAQAAVDTLAAGARQPSATRRPVRRAAVAAVVVLALCGGLLEAYRVTRPTAVAPAPDLRISPLASLTGVERHPSVSADGTHVAFDHLGDTDAKAHIYVKNLSDGTIRQVTSGATGDFQPVFSPDGTRLAFVRAGKGRAHLMVTPSSGGIEREVGEIADLIREFPILAWNADGQNLVVCDRPNPFQPDVAIFQVAVATGARRQLTFPSGGMSDWMPQVSPDGKTLGFARVSETGRGDLWSIPAGAASSSAVPRALTSVGDVLSGWSWADSGRELLISYRRSDRRQLWRQRLDSQAQTRVAGLDDQIKEVSVSRNGTILAYGPGGGEDNNIWWYPLPPSRQAPRTLIASAAFDGDARYSPDGKRIAFASERSGQANIWICMSDGTDLRQLTSTSSGGYVAGSPAWSPDGKWIAFDSRSPETKASIFLMDAAGGKPVRLTGPGPTDFIPAWSRDSRWIYFASDRSGGMQLWKVPSTGGEPVQVTRDGGLESFESPDGRYLYYTKRGKVGGFWRMPLQGGAEERVSGLETLTARYWEATGEGIYFVERSAEPELRLFHFSNDKITRILSLPKPPSILYRGLSISPDGRGFLYMQGDVGRSNLTLVENFH